MWQGVGGGCQCCKSWCHWQEDCCRTITINLTNAKLMGGCICLVRDQSRRSYWGVLQRSPVCFQHHLDVAVSTRCCGSHMQTNTKYTMCTIPIAIAKALIFVSQTITTIYLCSVLTNSRTTGYTQYQSNIKVLWSTFLYNYCIKMLLWTSVDDKLVANYSMGS